MTHKSEQYWVSACNKVLKDNDLSSWKTVVFSGRVVVGRCIYASKTIQLSRKMLEKDDDAYILDVIYHEVAHALTPMHGHDAVWRAKAIELGGSGAQYADADKLHGYDSKWVAVCTCGEERPVFRFSFKSIYYCTKCVKPMYMDRRDKTKVKFDPNYVRNFNRVAGRYHLYRIDQYGMPQL